MRLSLLRIGVIALASMALLGATAPGAFAGTIRYTGDSTAQYTVDNEHGITKISFIGCVTQGKATTIAFNTVIEGSNSGTATYKVLQDQGDEGELPAVTFDPATVTITGSGEQTIATRLTFTLSQISPSGTVFRYKLEPEQGTGLGEGPGVMVDIDCVQPAAFVAPAGPPIVAGKPVATVPVPTAVAGVRQGPARCIQLRRVTLRVGVRSRVVVIVTKNDMRVNRAYVRLIGPGLRRSAFTNGRGLAVFSIKPQRKGTLIIQSNVCVGADQKAVLGAAAPRATAGLGAAGFTG